MHLSLRIVLMMSLLAGCSLPQQAPDTGDTPSLAGSSWLANDIDDTGVTDKLQFTLNFDADLRVSGISGCNRYTGQATVSGQDLTLGPLASTRMACPEATMNQEDRFLAVLNQAAGWSLDAEGNRLTLVDSTERPVLRLDRVTGQD